jgi:tetratricopeptide (TPR) repeat protein
LLNPWSFQVINNFGSVLAARENYDGAISLYKKALDINPKYDEGKFNLAFCNYKMGNFQEALDWVSKVDTIKYPYKKEEFEKNRAIVQNIEKFEKEIKMRMEAASTNPTPK